MKLREMLIYLSEVLGISFSRIADRTGVDRTTIRKYVNGSREMSEANKVKIKQYLDTVFEEYKEFKEQKESL